MKALTRCKNCTKQYPADGRGNLCPACVGLIVDPAVVATPSVVTLEWLFARTVTTESGCKVWTGSKSSTGYGNFNRGGHVQNAHRAAYLLAKGPIPDGMYLDHLCRVPACINPDHLEVVTPAENTRRGVSLSALAQRSGLCVNGHELSIHGKQYPHPRGKGNRTVCMECCRARAAKRYTRKAAQA